VIAPGADATPPFHVHRGHAFEGFELVQSSDGVPLLIARCDCGAVLDVAEARFVACPECGGEASDCARCAGTGRVIEHAALQWRAPAANAPARD
jgi:hypothetical protein